MPFQGGGRFCANAPAGFHTGRLIIYASSPLGGVICVEFPSTGATFNSMGCTPLGDQNVQQRPSTFLGSAILGGLWSRCAAACLRSFLNVASGEAVPVES